jgi:hypothetical protein
MALAGVQEANQTVQHRFIGKVCSITLSIGWLRETASLLLNSAALFQALVSLERSSAENMLSSANNSYELAAMILDQQ